MSQHTSGIRRGFVIAAAGLVIVALAGVAAAVAVIRG